MTPSAHATSHLSAENLSTCDPMYQQGSGAMVTAPISHLSLGEVCSGRSLAWTGIFVQWETTRMGKQGYAKT